MSKKRIFWVAGLGLVVLCCWSAIGHYIFPPVRPYSLCGEWKAEDGSEIKIRDDYTFSASKVPFGKETRSGDGDWSFEQGASLVGSLMLRFREARTSIQVESERNIFGELFLFVGIDDPDIGEELVYSRASRC